MHPISKERQCPCGHLAASCALKKTQSRVPSLSMEFAFFIYCLFKANFSTKAIMQKIGCVSILTHPITAILLLFIPIPPHRPFCMLFAIYVQLYFHSVMRFSFRQSNERNYMFCQESLFINI